MPLVEPHGVPQDEDSLLETRQRARLFLKEKTHADPASTVAAIVDSNDRTDILSMCENIPTVGKRYFQSHSNDVMQHQRNEVKSIAVEINHYDNIFDVSEPRAEGAQVRGK